MKIISKPNNHILALISNIYIIQVYYKENDYNKLDDFSDLEILKEKELHIYTWMDATLRELSKN